MPVAEYHGLPARPASRVPHGRDMALRLCFPSAVTGLSADAPTSWFRPCLRRGLHDAWATGGLAQPMEIRLLGHLGPQRNQVGGVCARCLLPSGQAPTAAPAPVAGRGLGINRAETQTVKKWWAKRLRGLQSMGSTGRGGHRPGALTLCHSWVPEPLRWWLDWVLCAPAEAPEREAFLVWMQPTGAQQGLGRGPPLTER